jgi:NDP-sugar pyrophosphorylase family protein
MEGNMNEKISLVVLAAGMGSRYGGLKQLDSIGPNGETIIDYSIYDAIRAGVKKVVFIIRKDFYADFKELIGDKFQDKIEIVYAFQELDDLPSGFTLPPERKKPWGTGHALLSAYDSISEPFMLINGDDFYGAEAYKTAVEYLKNVNTEEIDISLVGFKLKNTLSENGSVSRGICFTDENSVISKIQEVTSIEGKDGKIVSNSDLVLNGDELVSMNMWLFTPNVIHEFKELFINFLEERINEDKSEFFIPSAVMEIMNKYSLQIKGLESDSSWFGVTYKEDKPTVINKVNKLIEDGVYPKTLI